MKLKLIEVCMVVFHVFLLLMFFYFAMMSVILNISDCGSKLTWYCLS